MSFCSGQFRDDPQRLASCYGTDHLSSDPRERKSVRRSGMVPSSPGSGSQERRYVLVWDTCGCVLLTELPKRQDVLSMS